MSAKDIVLKVLPSKVASKFIQKHHYSWKAVNNSQLHFWVFYKGLLGGVMSYWPSTDKSKLIWLIENTGWNEFIELNRMAFSDILPKYSESRAIAISVKLLKKKAPHLKWIISFADGCQCWDGTIYRASGFDLSQIKVNTALLKLPSWEIVHQLRFNKGNPEMQRKGYTSTTKYLNDHHAGWEKVKGFMLRYIKTLKPNLKKNYKILNYSEIEKAGAWMYLWEKTNASVV